MPMDKTTRDGVLYALGAYGIWGFMAIYFKFVDHIDPFDIVANRVVWSLLLLGIIVTVLKQWHSVKHAIGSAQHRLTLMLTTLLIASNWLLFVWAVNGDRMLEASLGYYINPLVNVLLGFVFLSERLNWAQTLAVTLAVIGVAVQIIAVGYVPWISLTLAFSFGLYGLLHKRTPVDGVTALFIETLLLLPVALAYMAWLANQGQGPVGRPMSDWWLLILAGPVSTTPLLFFTGAAKRLRLTTLGFFQFMAPSIMFLLAILVYGETLTAAKLTTFVFIWIGLTIYTINATRTAAKRRADRRRQAEPPV